MSAQFITDLSDAHRAPDHSVGTLGKQLAALDTKALPIPTTVIIPREALAKVLEESRLIHDLRSHYHNESRHDELSRYHLRQHVVDSIQHITFPSWFTTQLLDAYHRYLHRGFVKLQHGSIESRMDASRFEHIQGDANLSESLRNFWAKIVELELIKHAALQTNSLAPSSIIIQAQTQAEAAGIAYTIHPESGMRQHFFVQAIWGCPDAQLLEEQSDAYMIDNRTHSVIMRSVGTQTRYYRRKQDGLETIPIPAEHQNKPILTDELCAELSRILLRLKRQNLHQVKVTWELTPSGYEITSYTPFHNETITKKSKTHTTLTKVFVTGGNPHKTNLDPLHLADGIGIVRSEYTYFDFGIHPLAAIKGKQRAALKEKLIQTINAFKSTVNGKPILLRSLFATTQQLRRLQYAETEEPMELNPFLGWRGGLRLRHQPDFLKFELEVITEALHHVSQPLGYVVPFIRHPQELDSILQAIDDHGLQRYKHFQSWWQLNTPDNVLNIASYPTRDLTGVIIHYKTIQALLQGIDPDNPEIAERYSTDPSLFISLLEKLMHEIKQLEQLRPTQQPLQVLLYLEEYDRELVTAAVRCRCDGVIVKPIALAIAHETIAEYEQTHLGVQGSN